LQCNSSAAAAFRLGFLSSLSLNLPWPHILLNFSSPFDLPVVICQIGEFLVWAITTSGGIGRRGLREVEDDYSESKWISHCCGRALKLLAMAEVPSGRKRQRWNEAGKDWEEGEEDAWLTGCMMAKWMSLQRSMDAERGRRRAQTPMLVVTVRRRRWPCRWNDGSGSKILTRGLWGPLGASPSALFLAGMMKNKGLRDGGVRVCAWRRRKKGRVAAAWG
jgi:hypothetical protein